MKKITVNDQETCSTNVVAENIDHLQNLFPEAFTEGKIDFEVLKKLLGSAVDDEEEKYSLNWYGKRQARQLALTPSTGTLRPCPEESVDWDTTKNLMIEGDNLEVLKLLQKSYAGKVKLIYIDPPYNTGKDFIYPDNYRDNIQNYLELTGQIDDKNRKLSTNTEASGRFHTDWLNMMYPRLKLARTLLSNDGVLLVSINDIEVTSLRLVLNELFGEDNFLCQFIWNNDGNVDQQSKIKGVHEYIVAYARRIEEVTRPSVIDPNIEETSKLYNEEIANSITKNGPANPPSKVTLPLGFPTDFPEGIVPTRMDRYPHILDNIEVRESKLLNTATVESGWSSKNLLQLFISNGCIPIQDSSGKETRFALTKTGAIYGYKRRSELQGHVLSVIRNVGTTKQNSSMLKKWGIEFSYPKPVLLLQYLTQIFTSPGSDDLVIDFFAGSGTMGHAVLELNKVDGGHRRFCLVQFPETVDYESEEYKTLFDVCRKRIKYAIDELNQLKHAKKPTCGFRVFKLDTSNIRAWEPDHDDLEGSLLQNVEHIKTDRSVNDVLYELLLKLGLDLCVPMETRTIAGKSVNSVGAGSLITCLDEKIVESDIEALARGILEWHEEMTPTGETTVVFRDSAFADDITKTNLTAILDQHGLGTVRSL